MAADDAAASDRPAGEGGDTGRNADDGKDPTGRKDAGDGQDAGVDLRPSEPDYRFTLANERTFLAYLRTALALDAASVAAIQFLTAVEELWIRQLISIVLAVAGIAASIGAYVRWRANVAAMRQGAPLPSTLMPLGLAIAAFVVSVAAVFLVVFA